MSFTEFIKELFGVDTLESLENQTNAVGMLKADHRKVEILFKEFDKNENSQKQDLLDMIIKELTIHATVEEELVYPIIDSEDHDGTAEAQEEHHHVKLALAELSKIPANSEEAKPKVKVLSEMVKHHIKEEELHLFAELQKTDTDMEELGSRIKARKDALKTELSGAKQVHAKAEEQEVPPEMNKDLLAENETQKKSSSVKKSAPAEKPGAKKSVTANKSAAAKKPVTAKTSSAAKKPESAKKSTRTSTSSKKTVAKMPRKANRKAS